MRIIYLFLVCEFFPKRKRKSTWIMEGEKWKKLKTPLVSKCLNPNTCILWMALTMRIYLIEFDLFIVVEEHEKWLVVLWVEEKCMHDFVLDLFGLEVEMEVVTKTQSSMLFIKGLSCCFFSLSLSPYLK